MNEFHMLIPLLSLRAITPEGHAIQTLLRYMVNHMSQRGLNGSSATAEAIRTVCCTMIYETKFLMDQEDPFLKKFEEFLSGCIETLHSDVSFIQNQGTDKSTWN